MRTCRSMSIVFGVCLAASLPAHAQPLVARAPSIESMIANADYVFVAKLVKFGVGERIDGREVPGTTIELEETLKQDLFTSEPYRRMSMDFPVPVSALADWLKRSCRLLVIHDSDAPKG